MSRKTFLHILLRDKKTKIKIALNIFEKKQLITSYFDLRTLKNYFVCLFSVILWIMTFPSYISAMKLNFLRYVSPNNSNALLVSNSQVQKRIYIKVGSIPE